MKITVAACQQMLHEPLSDATKQKLKGMDFVCLPEHYPLAKEIRNLEEAASRFEERREYLLRLSQELNCVVVGGTLTEKTAEGYYNTCYVFDRAEAIGFYRKMHPTEREMTAGVLRGEEFKVFTLRGLRIGVLICADVLNPHSFDALRSLGCGITFVPTASPYMPNDTMEDKQERDRSIFVEGARRMQCPLVKTCGVGATFGHRLQGRSLIATPEGIVARAKLHQESMPLVLTAELDV